VVEVLPAGLWAIRLTPTGQKKAFGDSGIISQREPIGRECIRDIVRNSTEQAVHGRSWTGAQSQVVDEPAQGLAIAAALQLKLVSCPATWADRLLRAEGAVLATGR
jgi:hypothetical protein